MESEEAYKNNESKKNKVLITIGYLLLGVILFMVFGWFIGALGVGLIILFKRWNKNLMNHSKEVQRNKKKKFKIIIGSSILAIVLSIYIIITDFNPEPAKFRAYTEFKCYTDKSFGAVRLYIGSPLEFDGRRYMYASNISIAVGTYGYRSMDAYSYNDTLELVYKDNNSSISISRASRYENNVVYSCFEVD